MDLRNCFISLLNSSFSIEGNEMQTNVNAIFNVEIKNVWMNETELKQIIEDVNKNYTHELHKYEMLFYMEN